MSRSRSVVAGHRILVYGVTGSGKTTLAARISAATGIPWHSVDDLTWEPGWVPLPADEQRQRIAAICAGDRWILDTAYWQWLAIPMARADLIVALDYPRLVSLTRLAGRTAKRIIDSKPICNGNRETLRTALSPDSLLVWHFRSFGRKRRRIRNWVTDPSVPQVVRMAMPRDTKAWLRSLDDADASKNAV
jgi:adenylate kinase family enzyme